LKIAIPNKDLSPYGYIANKILTRSLCKNLTIDNLIIGENIGQTYSFVDIGNVSLGFASLSQLTCLNNIFFHSYIFNTKEIINDLLPHVLVLLPTSNIIFSRCFYDFTQTYITIKITQSFGYTVGPDVL
jgi:molybdate transport system substrate-binding protein